MYLGYQNDKIISYTEQPLDKTLYNLDKIEETFDEYVLDGNQYVLKNASWEQEQAALREVDFKSKFFYIQGFGWYRKQPKGYQSAIESLNTAFNRFVLMQQMGIDQFPANIFIFYVAPDFTKPEECTEEWLIEHQTKNKAMTVQEFGSFYATFTDAWNAEEHE